MAKQGFRVMDSDLHVVEPRNLWDNCARLYNLQPVSVESPGGN